MPALHPTVQEKLQALPMEPGVYQFFDQDGKILYIGKAKNLKNRVRTYFQETSKQDTRILWFVEKIKNLAWTITLSESDALILEDKLIKIHQPRYNTRLKDHKSYPFIKITKELFPRILLTRQFEKDGASYYGPYADVMQARIAINTIRRYFPLRSKNLYLDGTKTYKPCLNYQLKRCLAPCSGQVGADEYLQVVKRVEQMLRGNYKELLLELKELMQLKAEATEYEAAAKLRDSIGAIENSLKKKEKVHLKPIDADIFWIEREKGFVGVQLIFVRKGIVFSTDFDLLKNNDTWDEDILRSYFSHLYIKDGAVYPSLILVPELTHELAMLGDYLEREKGLKVRVSQGSKPEEKKLLKLAEQNAKAQMKLYLQSKELNDQVLAEVQSYLDLKKQPEKVECFDISHFGGKNTKASMVVFHGNAAKKDLYRQFTIKTVDGIDDYRSIHEAVLRRAKRAKDGSWPLPDLMIIDGGKGQIHTAMQALEEQGLLGAFDLIALAKGRSKKKQGEESAVWDYEYVLHATKSEPIPLKKGSAVLHFLQKIRDEAHRFAIKNQRKAARKSLLYSTLSSIQGIGEKKKRQLLQDFGSLESIAQASEQELANKKYLQAKDIRSLQAFFHSTKAAS